MANPHPKAYFTFTGFMVFLFIALSPGVAASQVMLSERVAVLGPFGPYKEYRSTFDAQLSSKGKFVIGREDLYYGGQHTGSKFHFWQTKRFDLSKDVNYQPSTTFYAVSVSGYFPAFSISPDERFVAIQSDNGFVVVSLKNFKVYQAAKRKINTDVPYLFLVWSEDSRYVGGLSVNNLLVWDVKDATSYELNETFAKYLSARLYNTSKGWLIQPDDESVAFIACGWTLVDCKSYKLRDTAYIVNTQDGEVVLTAPIYPGKTAIWQRNSSGNYEKRNDFIEEGIYPQDFSSGNNYLLARKDRQKVILNTKIWKKIFTIPRTPKRSCPDIIWLPNEPYLLSVCDTSIVEIYRVGNETPISRLDLNTLLKLNLDNLTLSEEEVLSTDIYGEWGMLRLSSAAVLFKLKRD